MESSSVLKGTYSRQGNPRAEGIAHIYANSNPGLKRECNTGGVIHGYDGARAKQRVTNYLGGVLPCRARLPKYLMQGTRTGELGGYHTASHHHGKGKEGKESKGGPEMHSANKEVQPTDTLSLCLMIYI